MVAVFAITAIYLSFIWLFFFKLKWLRFTPAWGIISGFFLLHLLLVPLVGLRFVAPYSKDLRVVQHTIQLIPRLPEPTLLTEVLAEPNVPVKKGTPLFRFDRSIYEARVQQAEAALAEAKQNVRILKADLERATQTVARAEAELTFAEAENTRVQNMARQRAASVENAQKAEATLLANQAAVAGAKADQQRAKLAYESEISGVNTSVAQAEADLVQQRFYLEQTTMYAPEDGMIVNLQVRPGVVSGILRVGAIASFIVDADRYLLGTYTQEALKFVRTGQPVEFALALYPGQIFDGEVEAIRWASGHGQFLPSGVLPTFGEPSPIQTRFAVMIQPDREVEARLPIGAEGAAVIYTGGGGFADLGRIALRAYSWLNWLYPLPF
jgi:multidrug resistance efflux pump